MNEDEKVEKVGQASREVVLIYVLLVILIGLSILGIYEVRQELYQEQRQKITTLQPGFWKELSLKHKCKLFLLAFSRG